MFSPIARITTTPATSAVVAAAQPTRAKPVNETTSDASTSATEVTLSAAAKAAAREAIETPAQTAREAHGNDRQAQRLLAKNAAGR